MSKKPPCYFIFCYWLIIWTIFFKLNITKANPYLLNLAAFLFTLVYLISVKDLDYRFILITIFLHFLLVLFTIEKITSNDIFYNVLIFVLYLIFLKINNTDIFEIYINIRSTLDKFKKNKFKLKKYILHILNKLNIFKLNLNNNK